MATSISLGLTLLITPSNVTGSEKSWLTSGSAAFVAAGFGRTTGARHAADAG